MRRRPGRGQFFCHIPHASGARPSRLRWSFGPPRAPEISLTQLACVRAEGVLNTSHLLVALQARTDAGTRTLVTGLRAIVSALRRDQATSIYDLADDQVAGLRSDAAVGRLLL